SVILAPPAHYRRVVPLALQSFGTASLLSLLREDATILCVIRLLLAFVIPPRTDWRHVRHLVALATVAALFSALVQRHGFAYHFYPARAAAMLLFATILLDLAAMIDGIERRLWRVALVGMAGFSVALAADRTYDPGLEIAQLVGVIENHAPHQGVVLYGVAVHPAFS